MEGEGWSLSPGTESGVGRFWTAGLVSAADAGAVAVLVNLTEDVLDFRLSIRLRGGGGGCK
jgi:hypothetical protein